MSYGQYPHAAVSALAPLTPAAGKIVKYTGASAAGLLTISAFAETLIDDADNSAARTTLGLVIGTDVQAYDADLTAVAAISTNGLIARTGAGTAAARSITQPAAGITVSDGDGVSGNPTLALANDLAALEGISANGFAARTGSDAWSPRTITGTANQVNVADGDGVSGNPVLSLPQNIHTGADPTFNNLTLSGDLLVQGSRTFVGGENTALADNYVGLNSGYTTDAAQSAGHVMVIDPDATATENVAGGGFVAGVASPASPPTIEVASTAGFAAGDIIQVQGSVNNDGLFEVQALLTAPVRLELKGIGGTAAVEDFSSNQLTTEAAAGRVDKVKVKVVRSTGSGQLEVAFGDTVPLTYDPVLDQGDVGAGGSLSTVNAGDSATQGGAGTYAAGDHQHPVATAAAVNQTSNAAAAEGSSTDLARADHVHSFTTAAPPASASLAAASAEGTGSGFSRDDHVHSTDPGSDGVDLGTSSNGWDVYARELDVSGKVTMAFSVVTATPHTVGAQDYGILFDSSAGNKQVDLPAATGTGRMLVIKNEAGSGNTVTVEPNGAETIDGASNKVLNDWESLTLIDSASGKWSIL